MEEVVNYALANNFVFRIFTSRSKSVCESITAAMELPHAINEMPILLKPTKFIIDKVAIQMEIEARIKWANAETGTLDESYKRVPLNETRCFEVYLHTVFGNEFSETYGTMGVSPHLVIYTVSMELLNLFVEWAEISTDPDPDKSSGRIYRWDTIIHNWVKEDNMSCDITKELLYGLDDHFANIEKDMITMKKQSDFMKKRMGLTSGTNVLLYGPPGTGKTSFVKCFSHNHNFPIFLCNLDMISANQMCNALNPNADNISKYKVVLVEDFDLYISGHAGSERLSELLNALDGIQSASNVIRFFSVNNPELVLQQNALQSRMRRMLYFGPPSETIILKYFQDLFPLSQVEQKLRIDFCRQIISNNITMRPLALYLSRFLEEPDPLQSAIASEGKWFDEQNFMFHMKNKKNLGSANKIKCEDDEDDEDDEHDEDFSPNSTDEYD